LLDEADEQPVSTPPYKPHARKTCRINLLTTQSEPAKYRIERESDERKGCENKYFRSWISNPNKLTSIARTTIDRSGIESAPSGIANVGLELRLRDVEMQMLG